MKHKVLFTALVITAMSIPSLSEAAVTAIPTFESIASSTDTTKPAALATREMPSPPTTRAAIANYSPAGCTGNTNYPHISGTDASVHGTMICNWAVTQVATATELTRDRWFGNETIARDFSQRDFSTWSGNATPHASCLGQGWYRYRGWSVHKSLEAGVIYSSDTRNWQIPGVSEFTC